MDNYEIAKALTGKQRKEDLQNYNTSATSSIYAEARNNSSEGLVDLYIPGTGEELEGVVTGVYVKEGDNVLVNLTGNTPRVTDNMGQGDALAETSNHFFYDDEGAHVSTVENDATTGANALVDSNGFYVRDGVDVLSSFTNSLIELGKNNPRAVIEFCDAIGRITQITATDGSAQFSFDSNFSTTSRAYNPATTTRWAGQTNSRTTYNGVDIGYSSEMRVNVDSVQSLIAASVVAGQAYAQINTGRFSYNGRQVDPGNFARCLPSGDVVTTGTNTVALGNFAAFNNSRGSNLTRNTDGTITVNTTGFYRLSIYAKFYGNSAGDIMHASVGTGTALNQQLVDFQCRASGIWDSASGSDIVQINSGQRLRPGVRCEQGSPNRLSSSSIFTFEFVSGVL